MSRRKRVNNSFILNAISFLLVLSVIFSLFGSINWFFELFSHFVWQYAILSSVLAIVYLSRKQKLGTFFMLLVFASQIYVARPFFVQDEREYNFAESENISVFQFNINHQNKNINEIVRWIISNSQNIDIVVLFEVNQAFEPALTRLKWAFPYHINNNKNGWGGASVFSKLTLNEMEVKNLNSDLATEPAIVIRGATISHDIPFVLYTAHPKRPTSLESKNTRDEFLTLISNEIANEQAKNKILVGDFNTTRFAPIFEHIEQISGLRDSNEGQFVVGTWPAKLGRSFGIGIDNLLISENIEVLEKTYPPHFQSDHLPVLTKVRVGR